MPPDPCRDPAPEAPPAARGPSAGARAAAWLGAAVLLAWGAAPYLPGQIDDPFIVFAYAHRLAEQGEVAWNTGARVEGFSSALHLLVLAAAAWLGLDLAVFARVLAFGCALGILAAFAVRARRPGDLLPLLLVAAWQPLQNWSVGAMETTLAALLTVVAWPLVLGDRTRWAGGVLLLALGALTRPEGAAWLALALVRRATLGRALGRPEFVAAAGLAAFGAWHVGRSAYFGAWLPTPYLVKIVAVDAVSTGARQLGRELLSGAALLLLTLVSRRVSPWAWLPLLVQGALLLRAGGDWMGHARFLVPGLLASVAAAWHVGEPRPPRAGTWVLAPLVLLGFAWEPSRAGRAGGAGALESGLRDPWFLARPLSAWRAPWTTPMLEETSFLVERVPPGAGAGISDVGLPGNLDDVRIWDMAGLTDRATALVIAGESGEISRELTDRYTHGDDVWCLRYGLGEGGAETLDGWLIELFPEVRQSRSGVTQLRWRCREGGAPGAEVVAGRWDRLLQRFPSQDWIRWHLAQAQLRAGAVEEARATVRAARSLADEGLGWVAFGEGQSSSFVPGRGWALYANGQRRSLEAGEELWRGARAHLDVDDPGDQGARVSIGWEPSCGEPVFADVHGAVDVAPPACAGRRRLVVTFLNDEARAGFDRNVYVTLAW